MGRLERAILESYRHGVYPWSCHDRYRVFDVSKNGTHGERGLMDTFEPCSRSPKTVEYRLKKGESLGSGDFKQSLAG